MAGRIIQKLFYYSAIRRIFNPFSRITFFRWFYTSFKQGLLFLPMIHHPIFLKGSYEPEVMKIFKPKKGETVIDVGAYVGAYSLLAAYLVSKEGRVIAIEASAANFSLLVRSVNFAKSKNIIPLNIALADFNGVIDFNLQERLFSSMHSIVRKTKNKVKVPCRTLDSLLSREFSNLKVDWIKIDVEGAECMVLKGMLNTMRQTPNLKIIIELHHQDGEFSDAEICNLLKSLHFRIEVLSYDDYGPRHIFAKRQ